MVSSLDGERSLALDRGNYIVMAALPVSANYLLGYSFLSHIKFPLPPLIHAEGKKKKRNHKTGNQTDPISGVRA